MPPPRVFDCFLFHNELDILECRLEELSPVVDRFVVVECGETHMGAPKPSHYLAAEDRFEKWASQIAYFWVPRLVNTAPRARENEHRERIRDALRVYGALADDIVIQSDVDEIPTEASVGALSRTLRNTRGDLVAFDQSPHYFAVDWKHPRRCAIAPAASRFADIASFWEMRKASAFVPCIPNAGWHFSWLGDTAAHLTKLASIYEGPEIEASVRPMLVEQQNWRTGVHVDGVQMAPIDIDETFPKFIRDRRCPATWFRPRLETP